MMIRGLETKQQAGDIAGLLFYWGRLILPVQDISTKYYIKFKFLHRLS